MYDPLSPETDHSIFKECDWSEFCKDAKGATPIITSEPQGKEVDICMVVESDHAGDKESHRLRSSFLIYVNKY